MTKPKTKPKAAAHSTARKTAKSASGKRTPPASSRSAARPGTKHARIIAMLRTPAGWLRSSAAGPASDYSKPIGSSFRNQDSPLK
jgi:hypothetical protein